MRGRFPGFPPPGDPHGEPGRPAFGPFGHGGGPGGFGPGGGPGGGRGGFGPGGGPHGGPWRGPGGGRRGKRGDVRSAVLALLAERPRHGYELIGEIAERSGGFWRPSPGSIYPTLQRMADADLVYSDEEGSKRLFALTDEGRAMAEKIETPPWEQFAEDADPNEVTLRDATTALMGAVKQVSHVATSEQMGRATDALDEARRVLYGILGETPAAEG